jgi:hypothetical protein
LALAFFSEIVPGSLVLCTQVQDETLGHVTKVTAEGEQEKNTSQTFLTGGKKLVNQVCFVWAVARKHTTTEKFVVLVKRAIILRFSILISAVGNRSSRHHTSNQFLFIHNFARPDRASVAIENINAEVCAIAQISFFKSPKMIGCWAAGAILQVNPLSSAQSRRV